MERSSFRRMTSPTAGSFGKATGPQMELSWCTNVGGTLFFDASDSTDGYELWRSDGSSGGTVMVKDINPGTGSSIPALLINVNGTLFFRADDGTNGQQLWLSNGTGAGTVMVANVNPHEEAAYPGSAPRYLTNVNG